jgi:hypothetical protein
MLLTSFPLTRLCIRMPIRGSGGPDALDATGVFVTPISVDGGACDGDGVALSRVQEGILVVTSSPCTRHGIFVRSSHMSGVVALDALSVFDTQGAVDGGACDGDGVALSCVQLGRGLVFTRSFACTRLCTILTAAVDAAALHSLSDTVDSPEFSTHSIQSHRQRHVTRSRQTV